MVATAEEGLRVLGEVAPPVSDPSARTAFFLNGAPPTPAGAAIRARLMGTLAEEVERARRAGPDLSYEAWAGEAAAEEIVRAAMGASSAAAAAVVPPARV